MTVKRQTLKPASAIALATVISRICRYLRDQRVALLLGILAATDTSIPSYGIPSVVCRTGGRGDVESGFVSYLREEYRPEGGAFACLRWGWSGVGSPMKGG